MKYINLIILFCTFTVAQAQQKTPLITQHIQSSFSSLAVTTSGGHIIVNGGNTSPKVEVFVEDYKNKKASASELQKKFDENYDLVIAVNKGTLEVNAKPKKKTQHAMSVSFTIYTPIQVETQAKTAGGRIALSNLTGKQQFKTSGGRIDIKSVRGQIEGSTSGGSIAIEDSHESIELKTSGGSIAAKNCTGTIKMYTSGGSFKLNNIEGNLTVATSGGSISGVDISGTLHAKTSGGSVTLNKISGNVEASTSGGSIQADIVRTSDFVKLNNASGNVILSLPAKDALTLDINGSSLKTGKLADFNGTVTNKKISGDVNGGGAAVSVQSSSGNVQLTLK